LLRLASIRVAVVAHRACRLRDSRASRFERNSNVNLRTRDYVKVEFPDEATGIGEWMWVPATVAAISDAIRWAEQIMAKIDERWPAK
jgi:hypothetical protein